MEGKSHYFKREEKKTMSTTGKKFHSNMAPTNTKQNFKDFGVKKQY